MATHASWTVGVFMKLLTVVPVEQLRVGDVVRVSRGDGASYLAVTQVGTQKAGVVVAFEGPGGHGLVVLYPYGEEVVTMTHDTEEASISSSAS